MSLRGSFMTPTQATVTHWKLRVSFDEPEVAILSLLKKVDHMVCWFGLSLSSVNNMASVE